MLQNVMNIIFKPCTVEYATRMSANFGGPWSIVRVFDGAGNLLSDRPVSYLSVKNIYITVQRLMRELALIIGGMEPTLVDQFGLNFLSPFLNLGLNF